MNSIFRVQSLPQSFVNNSKLKFVMYRLFTIYLCLFVYNYIKNWLIIIWDKSKRRKNPSLTILKTSEMPDIFIQFFRFCISAIILRKMPLFLFLLFSLKWIHCCNQFNDIWDLKVNSFAFIYIFHHWNRMDPMQKLISYFLIYY